jgi:allantoicase
MQNPDHSTPLFAQLADLASARTGGRAVLTNDDFFAPKSNLVKPSPPVFIPGKYTTRGKWMDGWESRRRRIPGNDWCIVELGMRGRLRGVDVDTSFFTGNFPSQCEIRALDAAAVGGTRRFAVTRSNVDALPWTPVLARVDLRGDSHNYFAIEDERPFTHLRLDIYPDGGVARLRVFGDVVVDWGRVAKPGSAVDVAAIQHGGLVVAASDVHYGAKDNMLMPGRAKNMGDGWETKRRRGPGHDWSIVRLGAVTALTRIEIDTNHFKGNYPDSAAIEGVLAPDASAQQLPFITWTQVLPQTKLSAHHRHYFSRELRARGPWSHVRLSIYPDGGISRFRVYGTPQP